MVVSLKKAKKLCNEYGWVMYNSCLGDIEDIEDAKEFLKENPDEGIIFRKYKTMNPAFNLLDAIVSHIEQLDCDMNFGDDPCFSEYSELCSEKDIRNALPELDELQKIINDKLFTPVKVFHDIEHIVQDVEDKPIIQEVQKDIFDYIKESKEGILLVHCISTNFGLISELNKKIDEIFKIYNYGRNTVGTVKYSGYGIDKYRAVLSVCSMFVKETPSDKATYDSIRQVLLKLKDSFYSKIVNTRVYEIVMPKIGVEDGLEWDGVKKIIEDVFKDMYIKITICG